MRHRCAQLRLCLMPVFEEKQEELEHYETMMGVPRGRLAVTMDTITDAMALVGQHGVYCQSQRWPGKPVMDIQIIMKSLTDAKELIQSVMEELKKSQRDFTTDHRATEKSTALRHCGPVVSLATVSQSPSRRRATLQPLKISP